MCDQLMMGRLPGSRCNLIAARVDSGGYLLMTTAQFMTVSDNLGKAL